MYSFNPHGRGAGYCDSKAQTPDLKLSSKKIQRIQLAPPACWRFSVCLTSFKVAKHMRDCMILRHSIEKDGGQTSPCNDL